MRYTVIILVSLLLFACKKTTFQKDGDYFFLENKGAKMPIWVNGNSNSDVLLITVHGGPGASGYEFPLSNGFKKLEEQYLIAYWDQRFSGLSQGQPKKSTITIQQFIEDTDKIIKLLNHKYPNKKLFLLGHSFGGQLTAGYLGKKDHQNQFNGWIDLDGSIYGTLEAAIMKQWILDQVPAKLAEPDADHEYWQYIIDWYAANPTPTNYTDKIPYLYAGALKGYSYDWEKVQETNPTPYKDLIFSSMFSTSFYVNGFYEGETWADTLNFTPELQRIEIPALLLWGKNDGAVPAAVGDYVYDNLKTDPAHKTLIKIEECSHAPHFDQPEAFANAVTNFIETYK